VPTIRIWNGAKVVQVISVSETGSSTVGSVGGAENSTLVDIEIDPWKGLIVDHGTRNGPLNWRAEQD
jgi:hypothetical protein